MVAELANMDIDQDDFEATYSAEDNKLRIYASVRLDEELYGVVKEAGFKWAPKQELFVAPMWTPFREDICLALAGEICPEGTTLVERAEAKAERLDTLADKAVERANAFHRTASVISERFAYGQPILVGHHSERKARRDQDRIHSAMDKAVQAVDAVSHWNWKAEGVERHANRKANPEVRKRRIKTLLAELRDRQRGINHAYLCIELWEKINATTDSEEQAKAVGHFSGAHLATGSAAPWLKGASLWRLFTDGKMGAQEVIDTCLKFHRRQVESRHTARWISHILNRLAFERSELGEVSRYTGEIKAATLQVFVREHGAHKPKAKKVGDQWVLTTPTPLPFHIGEGCELSLDDEGWRDLMQDCGYEVPLPKPKKPSILNFKAAYITGLSWGGERVFRQIEMTKAEYSAIYSDYRGVRYSACGGFRFKICKNPEQTGYNAEWCAVFLTDSKAHPAPESTAIKFDSEQGAS